MNPKAHTESGSNGALTTIPGWRFYARLLPHLLTVLALYLTAMRFAAAEPSLQLDLTEQAWLADHQEIVLASSRDNYPFEFFDEHNKYRGVVADYLALLEGRLGVRFRIISSSTPSVRLEKVRSKSVDMAVSSGEALDYHDDMLLTPPYLAMPGVIVGKKNYKSLENLNGKRVAVISGTPWEAFIADNHPNLQLIRAPDMISGLELVSLEAVDALLSDIATSSYYIHREGMTDISIVGKVNNKIEFRLAIRDDWPELNAIMEKALASISAAEKARISQQWIHLKQPSLLHSTTFWTIVLIISVTILLGLASILMWNRTLKQQVLQRTQSLNVELQRRQEAETELKAIHHDLVSSHKRLKQTQLYLIHAAKMESIGRIAAGIAHEVKNPLAVISLGLEYIAPQLASNETDVSALQDMSNAVSRADSVIKGLLDFSREDTLNSHVTDINTIILDSINLVKHELSQHNIDVKTTLDGTLPRLLLDTNKMQQVFVNLFLNATQAIGSDGTISISTYEKVLEGENPTQNPSRNQLDPSENALIIEVCDNGPGVDEKHMEKIFDPFYTTKPVGEGTGLGLSIIRNIIELHYGAIDVRNRETGGLGVRIALPMKTEGH